MHLQMRNEVMYGVESDGQKADLLSAGCRELSARVLELVEAQQPWQPPLLARRWGHGNGTPNVTLAPTAAGLPSNEALSRLPWQLPQWADLQPRACLQRADNELMAHDD